MVVTTLVQVRVYSLVSREQVQALGHRGALLAGAFVQEVAGSSPPLPCCFLSPFPFSPSVSFTPGLLLPLPGHPGHLQDPPAVGP